MTAEIKVFPDPQELAAYVQDMYDNGATVVKVTQLKAAVYLIQDESP